MKLSRVLALLAAAACLGSLPACSGGAGGNKIKVAVVSNNPEEFWTIAEAGANKAARDFDVDAIFRKPEKGDVGTQMNIINDLLRQGIQGIAISVINPTEQTPDLRRIAGEVKLITMDNDAPESNRICYVGTDNYEAGKAVGRLVKQAMPDGGVIAIFVGQSTPINARQRFQGVVDELAGTKDAKGPQFGKYTLHRGGPITDGVSRNVAQDNAKEVLESDEVAKASHVGLIGLWAYNPPEILKALRSKATDNPELAKKVRIVGFDEDWATLDGIDKGEIYATVVQDPFNFGYRSVEILAAEGRGDTSKRLTHAIPYRIVSKEGGPTETVNGVEVKNLKAAQFRDELKALIASARK